MSTIREVYEAAAKQKRELDAARPSDAEYIDTRDAEHWRCVCGNEPTKEGFYAFDRATWAWTEPGENWDGKTWRCDRCKRVIVGPHGYVLHRMTIANVEGAVTPSRDELEAIHGVCGNPGCEQALEDGRCGRCAA